MTDPRTTVRPLERDRSRHAVPPTEGPNRRKAMNATASGLAGAACLSLAGLASNSTVVRASDPPEQTLTPQQALDRLKQGNARYVAWRAGRGQLQNMPEATLEICDPDSSQNFQNSQTPFAIVLGCSDSRVPPELIFDQGFGDLFVTRTAGQTCDPIVLGTIEYAAFEIGTPPLLVVLGHSKCGAVTAAVDSVVHGTVPPGWIRNAVTPILPAARQANREMPRAPVDAKIARAVRIQAANVSEQIAFRSTWLASSIRSGRFGVVPAIYDLDSGVVTFLS